ncbi:hypothetical protein BKA67DRAFT_542325 [Truncatella angustata]|uniref:Uncharacterized protein n=1 Tax=Truncatella angustata TaxID=152316 RepID=A0A9P8UBP7_9PEZI|nr:uncharacterized protein BKA67DRAFT_542325 [Truncatella angustata]KAH6643366.1 hypothetical protein BKA67DRAFT_542325 [Truncatella angustata]
MGEKTGLGDRSLKDVLSRDRLVYCNKRVPCANDVALPVPLDPTTRRECLAKRATASAQDSRRKFAVNASSTVNFFLSVTQVYAAITTDSLAVLAFSPLLSQPIIDGVGRGHVGSINPQVAT